MSCLSSKYKFGEQVRLLAQWSEIPSPLHHTTYQSEPASLHSCAKTGGLQRATRKFNLKRCSNETELRLAHGWRSADQGVSPMHSRGLHRTSTGLTQRSVSAPPAAGHRHRLPQVHVCATRTIPRSQPQGAALQPDQDLDPDPAGEAWPGDPRLLRAGNCSKPESHEQGALKGCPESVPGGAERVGPVNR